MGKAWWVLVAGNGTDEDLGGASRPAVAARKHGHERVGER